MSEDGLGPSLVQPVELGHSLRNEWLPVRAPPLTVTSFESTPSPSPASDIRPHDSIRATRTCSENKSLAGAASSRARRWPLLRARDVDTPGWRKEESVT